ncbi:MAG: hypothetical protein ISR90_06915 [Candidatus Marinimicrobia bacterium]|nr:hypothetical protein [Candidatus Neomarinimicrobiota bacterium]MBL7023762.1 hypothetical protein [Candidatus Neomarinimicrobiota bacterium]MBL7109405.1 hypothetical protein [Candidatus Neomarinimicrobiota bacterium]
MRENQKSILRKIALWVLTLAILFQIDLEPPVICFESDGHINIETACDSSCEVPIQQTADSQSDCFNCFDIKLWNYSPDLILITNNTDIDFKVTQITQYSVLVDELPELWSQVQRTRNLPNKIPPLIKTTILLI